MTAWVLIICLGVSQGCEIAINNIESEGACYALSDAIRPPDVQGAHWYSQRGIYTGHKGTCYPYKAAK